MENLAPEVKVQLDSYKEKLTSLSHKIKAIIDQGRSISNDRSQLFLYKGMYKELKPFYASFNDIWDNILELIRVNECTVIFPLKADKQLQQIVERYYYEGLAIYEEYMNPTPTPPAARTDPASGSNITMNESRTVRARLPQINLPQFNGNPLEWPLFRDTYLSLIHNEPTLSNMEKFLFLVSCLSGPARSLISNVSLTENNYSQAWDILMEHYDDKRRLANTYLKQVLDFKPINGKPTAGSFKTLITSVIECIESFKHLKINDNGDFILSFLVLRCLDSGTKMAFEKKYADVEFPTYKNLVDFIKVEWKALDLHYSDSEKHSNIQSTSFQGPNTLRFNYPKKSFLTGNNFKERQYNQDHRSQEKHRDFNMSKGCCPVCKSRHTLYQCLQFQNASAANKASLLKNWPGCTNCLSSKHATEACTSVRRCVHCNQNHHSWLHQPQAQNTPSSSTVDNRGHNNAVVLGSIARGGALLGTAVVQAKASQDKYTNIRIVTDSGSQFSFITSKCASKLGLKVEPCTEDITGIGQVEVNNVIGQTNCSLRSSLSAYSSQELTTQVIVMRDITNDLPQVPLSTHIQSYYKGYYLADADFWKPGEVELLLGGDLYYDIIIGKPIKFGTNIPRLVPTIFGHIVAGPQPIQQKTSKVVSFLTESKGELKDIMNKFWEMEEVTKVDKVSEEDEYCEKHFQTTHYRLDTGRYVVSLPVKDSISTLENTKGQAFKRLLNLESKLTKDPALKSEYHQFMEDYLNLGHMKLATPGTAAYTIPHHSVIKTQNGSIKIRVVFDASCRSSNGSLNDHLFPGPKLQLDIRDLLMNFRTHKVAFTADIIKMFRQILVHPPDRKYQRVLWRFDPSEAVEEYELCTVTQGMTSAPFDAERTILQLVKDEGASFPLASQVLQEDIYVDDVATGASSEDEAKLLQQELIQLLAKGCFELSKWASNSQKVLTSLEDKDCQFNPVSLSSDEEPKIKLLGMQWIPSSDIFTYEITSPTRHPSKRAILSAIARIFDPLGFLSPVVFYAKIILQDMWIEKCDWDETGPPQICNKWLRFLDQLQTLSEIKIPRCFSSGDCTSNIIVGFSDASQRGYSAVLYLLNQTSSDHQVYLIKAKTKLAPIKPMTIPRLELSGALLLSRLYKSCDRLFKRINIVSVRFFSDSEVVLGWLSMPPQRLNAFVAHRVVEILELTDKSQWSHVKSEDNPADCSSRGILPSELPKHSLWWAGPQWLQLPIDQWPQSQVKPTNLCEVKRDYCTTLVAAPLKSHHVMDWMERFSSYRKLIHSMSYILRFINYLKFRKMEKGPVSLREWKIANEVCIKLTQGHHNIDTKHLRVLNSFVDEAGLLRVGGRLHNSSLQHDAKHPVIISGKCHFAKLLVDYYHQSYLHLGSSSLQAILQSKYWIVSARKLIRKRVFNCIKCYKANHTPQAPIMGNLPSYRLQEGLVFQHVGVDFGGPFPIRESNRRKAALGKSYLCLFICMSTKAVHLEVVSRCSTEAFLAVMDRFIARRGKPSNMYSDCGTNFVGAANKLRDIVQWQRSSQAQKEIIQHATQKEIQWSFNPPSAPHFGGIWEAGIKAAKNILHKIIGETPLTFEELTTLFCNIEGVLNSRPIAPIGSDPESIECLTPGHFLIGRALVTAPEAILTSENISPLKRWDMIKKRSQHFWLRWRMEYLNTLQPRRKWTSPSDNLKEGDLVIIKEPNSLQRSWPMARVISTHPGKDGIVRVVTIKTSTGTYKRPVLKLVPLTQLNNNVGNY